MTSFPLIGMCVPRLMVIKQANSGMNMNSQAGIGTLMAANTDLNPSTVNNYSLKQRPLHSWTDLQYIIPPFLMHLST